MLASSVMRTETRSRARMQPSPPCPSEPPNQARGAGASTSLRRRSQRNRRPGWTVLLLSAAVVVLALLATCAVAATPSYYKLLDIDPSSDQRTIKKAYRRLAQKLHPDKYPEKEAEFVKMSEAYQVLSDEKLREVYDQFGEEGVKRHRAGGPGSGSHDPFDIFSAFFGRQQQQNQVRKGPGKQFNLLLPLQDMYLGRTITLEYERKVVCNRCDGSGARSRQDIKTCDLCGGRGVRIVQQEIMPGFRTQMQAMCSACHGQGKVIAHACPVCRGEKLVTEKTELEVDILPGTEEGEQYAFDGEADEGIDEKGVEFEAGDVIVKVNSERPPGSLFRRRGSHLYLTRSLSLPDALLGFIDSFDHMDGRPIIVNRPGVTQNGWVAIVEGEGMPIRGHGQAGAKGNLYVEYNLILPDRVEGDLLTLLEKVFGRKALKATAAGAEGGQSQYQQHQEL